MKKLLVFLTAMFVLFLAACGSDDSDASSSNDSSDGDSDNSEPVEIRIGTTQTENSNYSVMLDLFKEEVEANSDGEITVNVHYNSELGGEREMVEALTLGTLESTALSTGVITNFVPEIGVLDIPFIFRDKDHARNVMNGEVGDELADKLEEHNLKILAWAENGLRHVTNNEGPITTPEDLEGLKIRTMEVPIHLEAFTEFGANPTPMAWGEVFVSLQQGVIDAQENPIAIMYSSKLNEVQDYASLTGHVYSPIAFMMRADLFDSLSEEQQQIVLDAAESAQQANYTFMDEEEPKQMQELEELGMEFNEVDKEAFVEAVQPVVEEHIDEFGDFYDRIVETE